MEREKYDVKILRGNGDDIILVEEKERKVEGKDED